MYYLYTLIGLSILCSVAAGLLAFFSWRNQADKGSLYYLLAQLAILLVACFVLLPVTVNYKAAIILGLLLSFLAILLHRLLHAPVTLIYAFDFLVILLYMAAFAALHPLKWPTPWLLLLLLLGGSLYWALLPRLGEFGGTFACYAIALVLMGWQAVEIVAVQPALWTWLALVGTLGFCAVKALLAIDYAYATAREPHPNPLLSAESTWARRVTGRVPLRLVKWAQSLQTNMVQVLERLKLPRLAQKSVALVPFLTLLFQWLLVLSIWGPALGWSTA